MAEVESEMPAGVPSKECILDRQWRAALWGICDGARVTKGLDSL